MNDHQPYLLVQVRWILVFQELFWSTRVIFLLTVAQLLFSEFRCSLIPRRTASSSTGKWVFSEGSFVLQLKNIFEDLYEKCDASY
jgi:hypothetical protein